VANSNKNAEEHHPTSRRRGDVMASCPKCQSTEIGVIFDGPFIVYMNEDRSLADPELDIYCCMACKYESTDWREFNA
jgi:hypothetical protein